LTNCDIVCNNVCNEKRVVPGTKATTQREGPVGDTRQPDSNTPQQVICNKANVCTRDPRMCGHNKPHPFTSDCLDACDMYTDAKCIPYPTGDMTPESEDVFYKMMWERLGSELREFQANGCHTIGPVVVLRFMDYIEEATPCHQS